MVSAANGQCVCLRLYTPTCARNPTQRRRRQKSGCKSTHDEVEKISFHSISTRSVPRTKCAWMLHFILSISVSSLLLVIDTDFVTCSNNRDRPRKYCFAETAVRKDAANYIFMNASLNFLLHYSLQKLQGFCFWQFCLSYYCCCCCFVPLGSKTPRSREQHIEFLLIANKIM